MKRWWRRVKAAFGLGAIWGATAGIAGTVGGVIAGLIGGVPVLLAGFSGVAMGTIGFVLGAGFATGLTLLHGNRTLDELSVGKAAGVGFLVGGGLVAALNLTALALSGSALPLGSDLARSPRRWDSLRVGDGYPRCRDCSYCQASSRSGSHRVRRSRRCAQARHRLGKPATRGRTGARLAVHVGMRPVWRLDWADHPNARNHRNGS